MAKAKHPRRRPQRPLPPPDRPTVQKTRRHPAIRRLTKQIVEREREGNVADARARADVGGMLREVRAELEDGEWLAWLDEEVPYSPRTAQRAMALHTWAVEHPKLFARIAPMGASKVSLLASALPPADILQLAKNNRVPVPGSSVMVPFQRLSFAQLVQVLRPRESLAEERARERRIARLTRGIRRIAKASAQLDPTGIPRATAERWHTTLLEAAAEIADRFELE